MTRVVLIHWNTAEAEERAARLEAAGCEHVLRTPPDGAAALALLKRSASGASRPRAIVIDLGRLPSHGREVACALRGLRPTRTIPLVFVGGAADKVARVRALLPDATYTSWRGIKGALRRAGRHPTADPIVPAPFAAHSGTPLVRKLGVKPGHRVALVAAPEDFDRTLGPLPDGVRLLRRARGTRDLTLWFVPSRAVLERRIERMAEVAGDALWIAWPKLRGRSRASGAPTQADVRRVGLAAGLVDFKICSIDETWSGLRFTRRRAKA